MTPPSEKPERPYLRVEYRLESNREASWGVFVVVSLDENVLATFTSKVEATAWMRSYEWRIRAEQAIRERDEARAALTGGRKKAIEQRDKAERERDDWRKRAEENAAAIEAVARDRDEAREQLEDDEWAHKLREARRLLDDADGIITDQRAHIASLEGALREATEEIKRNRWVLGLVAEQQHKALEAIHIDLTDEEWAEFALALSGAARAALAETGNEAPLTGDKREDSTAKPCDGTCPKGRYCPEHGDLLPEDWAATENVEGGAGGSSSSAEGVATPGDEPYPSPSTTPERCPTCGSNTRHMDRHPQQHQGNWTQWARTDATFTCPDPWHNRRAGHTETST